MLAYLQRYARHFGLYDVVEFRTRVERCRPLDAVIGAGHTGWKVELIGPAGPEVRRYAGLVVATGHDWSPKVPQYPGQDSFTGEILHSAGYKSGDPLAGRRVVVVGAGNTGCDIVVEAAQRADAAHHSTRRAYWYAPKYALGRPADQVSDLIFSLRLPCG